MASTVPTTTTNTKVPYWAGAEGRVSAQTDDSSSTQSPVPVASIAEGGYTYEFVSNPYASAEPGTPPQHIPAVEANNPSQKSAGEASRTHQSAPEQTQSTERSPSAGSIFNGRQSTEARTSTPSRSSAVKSSLTSKFGSVRRAASTAKKSLSKRVHSSGSEVRISGPVPGSFHRATNSHVLTSQDGVPPLELIGLEQAQANPQKYGRPDHDLADISAAAVKTRASAIAAAERMAFPDSPRQSSSSTTHSIPRKPVTPCPAMMAAPFPSAQVAPPRNPRRVVTQTSRGTMWGQFVEAGMNDSWATQSQYLTQGEGASERLDKGNGKGKSTGAAPVSNSNGTFSRHAPTDQIPAVPPLRTNRPNTNNNPSLAPAIGRASTITTVPNNAATPNTRLAATLASQGIRSASYVPGVRCSDCGLEIDVEAVATHYCAPTSGMFRPMRTDSQLPAHSRGSVYAANYPISSRAGPSASMQSQQRDPKARSGASRLMSVVKRPAPETELEEGEPEVIVDTFVVENHTSWIGAVRSSDGSVVRSGEGLIGDGLRGQRVHEGKDAEDVSKMYRSILGIG